MNTSLAPSLRAAFGILERLPKTLTPGVLFLSPFSLGDSIDGQLSLLLVPAVEEHLRIMPQRP
ncbi:MAG: hypothetical protein ACE5ER_11540, partial [Nitrospinaceae bacterium]